MIPKAHNLGEQMVLSCDVASKVDYCLVVFWIWTGEPDVADGGSSTGVEAEGSGLHTRIRMAETRNGVLGSDLDGHLQGRHGSADEEMKLRRSVTGGKDSYACPIFGYSVGMALEMYIV